MNKLFLIFAVMVLFSCSQEPEEDNSAQWPHQDGVLGESQKEVTPIRKKSSNHVLKGYQDNIERAKDMEKEVLKQAEQQRKIIDG